MELSFSEKIIVERLLRAEADMLFASPEQQEEVIEGLRDMEPGDVRVGEAAGQMLEAVRSHEDALPLLRQVLASIEGRPVAEPGEEAVKVIAEPQTEKAFAELQEHWSKEELVTIFGSAPATVDKWIQGGGQSAHNQKKTKLIWRALAELGPREGRRWVEGAELHQWKRGEGPSLELS